MGIFKTDISDLSTGRSDAGYDVLSGLSLKQCLQNGCMYAYRKLYMKRINNLGEYEADWFEITEYVTSWGVIGKSFGDNIFYGDYQIDNYSISLNNSTKKFNRENDSNSFFSGFRTRFKTKFKIEVGHYDTEFNEIIDNQFYGILNTEPHNNSSSIIQFDISSTLSMLKLYPAYGIDTSTKQTDLWIDALVKKTVNGVRLFDQIFEGSEDSTRYQITAGTLTVDGSSVENGASVWDEIIKYSKYEGYFPYVNFNGNFVWASRSETTNEKFYFNGSGSGNINDYPITIISIDDENDGISDSYQNISVKYQATPELYETASQSWTPGDGSIPDIYGEKVFSADELELTQPQAALVAANLLNILQTPKRRWSISTCFIPHLELKDKIVLNYQGELSISNPFIIGISTLGSTRNDTGIDILAGYQGSISIKDQNCVIIEIAIDLDNFVCNFILKEC